MLAIPCTKSVTLSSPYRRGKQGGSASWPAQRHKGSVGIMSGCVVLSEGFSSTSGIHTGQADVTQDPGETHLLGAAAGGHAEHPGAPQTVLCICREQLSRAWGNCVRIPALTSGFSTPGLFLSTRSSTAIT